MARDRGAVMSLEEFVAESNSVKVGLGLAQEVIALLRSYLEVADTDIQRTLISQAIEKLVALNPTALD